MSSYYDDEDDLDIRVSRRRASPPVHYVEARPRPRTYYPPPPNYLAPERTVITTRSRSRERSRERRSSPPVVAPAPAPVIINNRIYNEHSSDEEDARYMQVARPRRRSHSRSRSSSYTAREEYEMERTRRELEELRIAQAREKEERRAQKEYREGVELQRAKRELDEIKEREAKQEQEKQIKKQLELERLREEEREAEEKAKREKEAKAAVELYKQKELERVAKEREEAEQREKEYKRRLQEDLINSGLDEKAIAAIIKKEKIPEPDAPAGGRPTYTRMRRRHLSIETLRTFRVEYELDVDPEFVLIKRWVPEWEQDALWKHTQFIREKRSKSVLQIEDKRHHHHHHEPEFEWVRKKSDRKRSKSPALLMYLAGARPA